MIKGVKNKLQEPTFKNKKKHNKLICPICGERFQRISKRNKFINAPAGIYLIFSSNRCKRKFVELLNEDNSELNITNIIEHQFN